MPSVFAQKTILVVHETGRAEDDVYLDLLRVGSVETPSGTVDGLGYNIVAFDDDDYTQDTFTAADGDLILLLESPSSGNFKDTHGDDPLPVVCMESFISDNREGRSSFYFNDTPAGDYVTDFQGINITDNTHPITSIFPVGNLQMWTGDGRVYGMNGIVDPAVTVLGYEVSDPARVSFAAVEQGTTLAGAPAGISPTPAKRVFLNLHQSSFDTPTHSGAILYQRMVQWAIGDPVTAGEVNEATLFVSRKTLDFGTFKQGSGLQTEEITITNSGPSGTVITIDPFDLSQLGDFTLASVKLNGEDLAAPYGTTLNGGVDTMVITVDFQADVAGNYDGTIRFSESSSAQPIDINLLGKVYTYHIILESDHDENHGKYGNYLQDLYGPYAFVDLTRRKYRDTLTEGEKAELAAADLIIISRDTSSGSYDEDIDFWNGLATPIMQNSVYLTRDSRWKMTAGTGTPNRYLTGFTVEAPDDPIFEGVEIVDGEVQIFSEPLRTHYADSPDAGNGDLLCRVGSPGAPTGLAVGAGPTLRKSTSTGLARLPLACAPFLLSRRRTTMT